METTIKSHKSTIILKLFIFFSLIFPMYYVAFNSSYYSEFSIANLFISLFILLIVCNQNFENEHKCFIIYLAILLIMYNLAALYINFTHSRWLWENFNVSLAFILLIALLLSKKQQIQSDKIIPFTIACQLITMITAIITYFAGYTSVSLMNGHITLIPHDPNYYEKRFNWLYFHKSQYCFILLLFIGLFFAHRKYCKNKLLFILFNLTCLFCIILSHTYTALFASFLIYIGYFIDYIKPQIKKMKRTYWLFTIPILVPVILIIYKMAQERNIFTLGGRVYIWAESIRQILQHPLGIGNDFGLTPFAVPELSFKVYNCHNVFLNEMYRFSIPVGLLFTIIFFSTIIYSLKKNFSFLNLGIWGALLISLNMDYSLLGRELTITVLYIYMIFFLPYNNSKESKLCKQ